MIIFGLDTNSYYYGVRLFIWLYLMISMTAFFGGVIYWYRDKIKYHYWKFRFPEKIIRIIIHYPNHIYKECYRLIPTDDSFIVDDLTYFFSDKEIIKSNDFYSRKDGNRKEYIIIDGINYEIDEALSIKRRKENIPEIHYYFNNPKPIAFEFTKTGEDFTATDLTDFKRNTLFQQLLTLEDTKTILIILIVLVVVNILMSIFIIAKQQGWLDNGEGK